MTPVAPGPGVGAHVFVASCSGCARLSGEIGLPLVHVDVAADVDLAVRLLNRKEHAAGVRVPNLFQPIGFDRGWGDWAVYDYSPCPWPRGQSRPSGVRVAEGRICVGLPSGVTLADLRGQLRTALRHLRLQEVTSAMAWLKRATPSASSTWCSPGTRLEAGRGSSAALPGWTTSTCSIPPNDRGACSGLWCRRGWRRSRVRRRDRPIPRSLARHAHGAAFPAATPQRQKEIPMTSSAPPAASPERRSRWR